MSVTQARNFRELKGLLTQLRSFGLNPTDWRIVRSSLGSANRVELKHRLESELRVNGHIRPTKSGSPGWAQLSLTGW
jgi:hypothetical protein